jgi:predicted neuraminidase
MIIVSAIFSEAWFGGTRDKHPDVSIWVSRFEDGKWTAPVEVANGVESPERFSHRCTG